MLHENKEIWDINNLESSDEEDNDSGLLLSIDNTNIL